MPRSLTQVFLLATALLFGHSALASLSFHTDKLQVSPGDEVKYSLTAVAPQGKPQTCTVSFSIPIGMTFVRDTLSSVGPAVASVSAVLAPHAPGL